MNIKSTYLLGLSLFTFSFPGLAAIQVGHHSVGGVEIDRPAELFLVIWDPVTESSYTKDLGIQVASQRYTAIGDPSKNLFIYGQQDAGYQKLFEPLNQDANFSQFMNGSNKANQLWGIFGISSNSDDPFAPAADVLYMTLQSTELNLQGQNQHFENLKKVQTDTLRTQVGEIATMIGDITNGSCRTAADNSACLANFGENLSAYRTAGQLGYAGTYLKKEFAVASFNVFATSPSTPNVFNPVGNTGSSSWFYTVSVVDPEVGDRENGIEGIDEFDNGNLDNPNAGRDAYWGLGVDGNGNYILSYTLPSVLTATSTTQGALLRLNTDYLANYGGTRLLSVSGDPFAGASVSGLAGVSPVPEPATWGLMGLGLAAIAGLARRQKRGAAQH